MKAQLRFDRLLANLGYGSRREVQELFRAGRVTLAGKPVARGEEHIALAEAGNVRVAGEPLDPLPGFLVMLHKPLGVTCSHKDEGELVYDLFPERWRKRTPPLSTVGRLDKETSGLLLLTDDGPLLHRLTSPRHELPKTYRATLARPLQGTEAAMFAAGTLLLEGETKPLLPAELEVLSPTEARLTIREGRYHQVRRMFAAAGNHVLALHREKIGALALPEDLAPGAFRLVAPPERLLLGIEEK